MKFRMQTWYPLIGPSTSYGTLVTAKACGPLHIKKYLLQIPENKLKSPVQKYIYFLLAIWLDYIYLFFFHLNNTPPTPTPTPHPYLEKETIILYKDIKSLCLTLKK